MSEGRRADVVGYIAAAAGDHLLDVHSDVHHHRSVLTLAGPRVENAVRAVARVTVERIDLRTHEGVHPRLGALDVVPFVALRESTFDDAIAARDRFARWAADALDLPCFVYGPERSLPDIRRDAFRTLTPDTGPVNSHPSAGATAVGARPVLVAYNVWLDTTDLALTRAIAGAVRGPCVRALAFATGSQTQVSMNLIEPARVGPAAVVDAILGHAAGHDVAVERTELVGLVPDFVLSGVPETRWAALDLDRSRTIEARLRAAGWAV